MTMHAMDPHDGTHLSAAIAPTARRLRCCRFKRTFADDYDLGPMLGSGSFGTVHVAIERSTGYK